MPSVIRQYEKNPSHARRMHSKLECFSRILEPKNRRTERCAVFVAKGTLCADVLFGNGQKVHEYDATGAPHPVIGGNKQCLPLVVDHFMDYW